MMGSTSARCPVYLSEPRVKTCLNSFIRRTLGVLADELAWRPVPRFITQLRESNYALTARGSGK
jgi:hypothetical protein